jgi:hypothetical protein
MSWSDPDGDLRHRPVVGDVTGQNRTFITFDDRIVASGNQSVCATPLRVWAGGVELAASGITVTDQTRGEFELQTAPSGVTVNDRLTASYYFKQHLDNEVTFYLAQAANFVAVSTVGDTVAGLQPACLHFAGSLAHTKLAQRWQQRKSEQFMLQDQPAREMAENLIKFHTDEAARMMQTARELRDDYYEGHGKQKTPSFGLLKRTPTPYTPRR